MKKFFFIFVLFLFLSLNIFTIPCMAQPRKIKEGVYSARDLNLSPNIKHTIENDSDTDYAFMMIFDTNQIAQQLMQLRPKSKQYILSRIQPGYEILIVTNGEVIIN